MRGGGAAAGLAVAEVPLVGGDALSRGGAVELGGVALADGAVASFASAMEGQHHGVVHGDGDVLALVCAGAAVV